MPSGRDDNITLTIHPISHLQPLIRITNKEPNLDIIVTMHQLNGFARSKRMKVLTCAQVKTVGYVCLVVWRDLLTSPFPASV